MNLPAWLKPYPDWIAFTVVVVVVSAGFELLLGEPVVKIVGGSLVGGVVAALLFRFWLLKPPARD